MTLEPKIAPAPDAPAADGPARRWAWVGLLAVGAFLGILRFLLPALTTPLSVCLAAVVLPALAMASRRATSPGTRRAFAIFTVAATSGILSFALYPYPSLQDLRALIDLVTYGAGIGGLVFFIRGTGRPDADAWLDAGALGVAASLLLFEFVRVASDAEVNGRDAGVSLLIAAIDAALLTCLARFVIRPLPSRGLSAIGTIIAIAAAMDAGYYTAAGGTPIDRTPFEAVWFLAYGAWAAAGLHPALPRLIEPGARPRPDFRSEMRSSMVAIGIHSAGFVANLAAIWHHARSDAVSTDWLFVVVFFVQLSLVVARSYRIVRRLADDVERREEAERALRGSERRFRTLTDTAPVGIFVADAAGRSVFQNLAWQEISGIHPTDGLGDGYQDAIHPDDREWATSEWLRCAATEEPFRIQHRFLRPDGEVRWVSSRATPLRDEAGAVTGWVGTVSDVTDLVLARTEAQDAADFVAQLIEQSPVGIHVYGPDGRTLSINGAKRRIRERVLGHGTSTSDGVVDVRVDPLMARLGQGGAIGRVFRGEAVPDPDVVRVTPVAQATPTIPGADGALDGLAAGDEPAGDLALRVSWYPVHAADGGLEAVISFTEDVTEAVRAQDQQRRIESRLAEASQFQALAVLAGGIAHDFNNLLGAILGRASLARQATTPGTALDQDLRAIEIAADRASTLARQMLSFAGRGRIVAEQLPLERVVREALEAVTADLDPQAILDISYAPDLEPVDVDPGQARQLILNLVENAAEALEHGPGRISVRTGRHRLVEDDRELIAETPLEPGRYVVLEVEDDGTGIDERMLGRVFKPFFTTRAVGRGLGLAAALGIVKAHGAGIRIRSNMGTGTRVQVLFPPAARAVDAEAPTPAPGLTTDLPTEPAEADAATLASTDVPEGARDEPVAQPPGSVGPILVVDDEPWVSMVARRVLEREGHAVVEAPGGAAGIAAFDRQPDSWGGAVVDLTMPEVDGLAVVEHMRRVRPRMPVVICSGWAAQEVAERLATVPGAIFLEKPYRPAELVASLRRAAAAEVAAR